MSLRNVGRRVKMDILHQEGDVCELLFANKRTQHAARLFLEELKRRGGLTRLEFGAWVRKLEAGTVEVGFRYSRTWFYEQIRRSFLTLGLVGVQQRPADSRLGDLEPERRRSPRGVVDKYVAVRQPIAKRAPDGLNLVRLTWIICAKWNEEFFSDA